jgi:hypothetical protein
MAEASDPSPVTVVKQSVNALNMSAYAYLTGHTNISTTRGPAAYSSRRKKLGVGEKLTL